MTECDDVSASDTATAWDPTRPAYLIGGRRFTVDAPGFADAIAAAHEAHHRPRCLCVPEGAEMYVARLGDGFIVKRMPETGCQHAPECTAYEPPADSSGLGQVLGTAITEDPATGETALRLDFALARIVGRSATPAAAGTSDSVASDGTRLSLRGLLHYLWDQAQLTHWKPGFAGRRNWATVRRHLLQAAQGKTTRSGALQARLYVPEMFAVDQRDAINARRIAHWAQAVAAPGQPQQLMLLIGEVKEIAPARYGHKAVVKHLPDQAFALDETLYRRLGRRFEGELAMWGASDDLHMVMIATFGVNAAGLPAIGELSLMPVTAQWLPVADVFEQRLVDRLMCDGRSFVKGLRYNLGEASQLACATLTDCEASTPMLFVAPAGIEDNWPNPETLGTSTPVWFWDPSGEVMPALPPR